MPINMIGHSISWQKSVTHSDVVSSKDSATVEYFNDTPAT
jgi:hypothetical protein